MPKIRELHLAANQLSGSIPPELGNAATMEWLWLSLNQLSGTLPPELGNLSQLERLLVNMNRLEGDIPESFAQLSSLKGMNIGDNPLLSKHVPDEVCALPMLSNVSIGPFEYACR